MAPHDEDETFSDWGELENLPDDALAELESNAIQFTQAQNPAQTVAPSSDYGDDFDDADLDDNVVIDESRSTQALNPTFQPRAPSQQQFNRDLFSQRPATSSTVFPAIEQRSRPPPPRFDQSQKQIPHRREPVATRQNTQPQEAVAALEDLQRQIEELTRERNALKDDVNSKAGEIAIVRSKQEKSAKEHEKELISIRKLNADVLARQAREIEAARISERNAATERDFLKQDAAETLRSRRVNQAKDQNKRDEANLLSTPRKKLLAHRDGFDDDEIEFLSPSKNSPSKLRKTNTPSKAAKRKRKNPESPAGPLEVINLVEPVVAEPKQPVLDEAMLKKLSIQDDRFDFLGTILDHRVDTKHKRTIEELGKYAFPSDQNESLQSILLGKIPTLGRKRVQDLPLEFCDLVVSLWQKCMEEKYFSPVYLFVDILTLALELKTSFIAPHLTDSVIILAQNLLDPIVVGRFKNRPPDEPYDKTTTSTACLSLLYAMALGCMCNNQHIVRFWRFMRFDLTMMIITPGQQISDTELMLKLLSTSIFRDSFGAPIPHDIDSHKVFTDIVSKLTWFLGEAPPQNRGGECLPTEVISRLRLQVLQLMTSMTRSPFASCFMAEHTDVIGKLVKVVSDELDELYDYKTGREEKSRIISLAVRLLYYLVIKHDDIIHMPTKKAVIPGGSQKYLLCLARLSFIEDDLLLEAGIDPDVAALALELLEMLVTPEEGDAIHSAFSSAI